MSHEATRPRRFFQLRFSLESVDIVIVAQFYLAEPQDEVGMSYCDDFIGEFDESTKITHISARREFVVNTEEQLNEMFTCFHALLESNVRGRCYLLIDLPKFCISPELQKRYGEFVKQTVEKYGFPGGVARYGYHITRVTVKLGLGGNSDEANGLFSTRAEATEYLMKLIADRSRASADMT